MGEVLLKTNFVRDFKIMFQANDKGTQITLPKAILVNFVVNFEHALISWGLYNTNHSKEFWKKTSFKSCFAVLKKTYRPVPS